MNAWSLASQLKEATRELNVRRRVYPGWVARENITAQLAEERLGLQESIVATLTKLAEEETGQLRLLAN